MLTLIRSQRLLLTSVFLLLSGFTLIAMRLGSQLASQTPVSGLTAVSYGDNLTILQPQWTHPLVTNIYFDLDYDSVCVEIDSKRLGESSTHDLDKLWSDSDVFVTVDDRALTFANGNVYALLTYPLLMTAGNQVDIESLLGYCIALPSLERGVHEVLINLRSTTGHITRIFWMIEVPEASTALS